MADPASEPPTRKRFQRKQPSAEYQQEDYEQNTLGVTAGFFCAIWAGWLMGEHFSSMFTSFNYPDSDVDGRYHFGGKDVALVVLAASKVLFVRAAGHRYVLRPLLSVLGMTLFEKRQSAAECMYTAATCLLSVWFGAYYLQTLDLAGLWSGDVTDGVTARFKLFVLGQCALQLAAFVAEFFEGENCPGYYRRLAIHYLRIGVLACSGLLGLTRLVGAVVLVADLSVLFAAVSGASSALDMPAQRSLNIIAGAVSAAASLIVLPVLVLLSLSDLLLFVADGGNDRWMPNVTQMTLAGSLAALSALLAVETKRRWWDSSSTPAKPLHTKKTL